MVRIPNNRIKSEAVEYSIKLWILLAIFVLFLFLANVNSDSHRHVALHMFTVTPIGTSTNVIACCHYKVALSPHCDKLLRSPLPSTGLVPQRWSTTSYITRPLVSNSGATIVTVLRPATCPKCTKQLYSDTNCPYIHTYSYLTNSVGLAFYIFKWGLQWNCAIEYYRILLSVWLCISGSEIYSHLWQPMRLNTK